ncbi:MAG: hypothetical protein DRQ10_00210 [Candidatus Hydrothermota bacterium]|nr:MAG: hypothetical protein DRQ10_00210 [Candidatus Hydrothermae bacterium]
MLVTTVYLARRKQPLAVTALPMAFMLLMTGWAMVKNIIDYHTKHNILLFVIGIAVFILEIWMVIEAALVLRKYLARRG